MVEERLCELGLSLPPIFQLPSGMRINLAFAKRCGNLLYVSGQGPSDGQRMVYQGKVGRELSVEEGYAAARLTALNILRIVQEELGSLDAVQSWVKVLGFINSAPGFNQQPAVLNGFSDLIVDLYGEQRGRHARSAVGIAELPFDVPVEIEAILEIGA
ncbi:MAG TPA: RidA family protein [Chloroflexota bacterium]|nr:RidA family protein [Chloroflexota bacterium]